MNSKKKPLWLVFKNADPEGENLRVMFKSGDDLRQDQMTLQIIRYMDKIWRKEGLDLRMTPYQCVSTGDELGMLEVVVNSDTTANIHKATHHMGALDKTSIATWLKESAMRNGMKYDDAGEALTLLIDFHLFRWFTNFSCKVPIMGIKPNLLTTIALSLSLSLPSSFLNLMWSSG